MEKSQLIYRWIQFESDCNTVAKICLHQKLSFKNIYGVPRGGLVFAVKMSHLLNIPLILDPSEITPTTLIVDDIADSGVTLYNPKFKYNFTITLFYNQQSKFEPNFWLHQKPENAWVIFPWENTSTEAATQDSQSYQNRRQK